jgi:hypothetical protein
MATFGIPQARHRLRLACTILGLLIAVGVAGACGGDEEPDRTGTAPIGGDVTPGGKSADGPDTVESPKGDGDDGGVSVPEATPGPPGPGTSTRPRPTPTDIDPSAAPDER